MGPNSIDVISDYEVLSRTEILILNNKGYAIVDTMGIIEKRGVIRDLATSAQLSASEDVVYPNGLISVDPSCVNTDRRKVYFNVYPDHIDKDTLSIIELDYGNTEVERIDVYAPHAMQEYVKFKAMANFYLPSLSIAGDTMYFNFAYDNRIFKLDIPKGKLDYRDIDFGTLLTPPRPMDQNYISKIDREPILTNIINSNFNNNLLILKSTPEEVGLVRHSELYVIDKTTLKLKNHYQWPIEWRLIVGDKYYALRFDPEVESRYDLLEIAL